MGPLLPPSHHLALVGVESALSQGSIGNMVQFGYRKSPVAYVSLAAAQGNSGMDSERQRPKLWSLVLRYGDPKSCSWPVWRGRHCGVSGVRFNMRPQRS